MFLNPTRYRVSPDARPNTSFEVLLTPLHELMLNSLGRNLGNNSHAHSFGTSLAENRNSERTSTIVLRGRTT